MDAIKGGGGQAGVVIEEDMGDGMQCSDHPFRNNPGGICALCLQEKLGKLVSSSFPLPIPGSSSSSCSPSCRSDIGTSVAHVGATNMHTPLAASLSLSARPTSTKVGNDSGNTGHYREQYARRARIPFLLAKKKKKIMVSSSSADRDIVFKRSKSTTTSITRRTNFLDDVCEDYSPRKRGGFWSFLYLSSSSSSSNKSSNNSTTGTASRRPDSRMSSLTLTPTATTTNAEMCLGSSLSKKNDICVVVEEDDSPNSQATASAPSFDRKVSRSRSVGCGSRSFSGDFFERISTGFGDCTLRRVESQSEGKPKVNSAIKERVKCGGIFGGFIITSSSSSSSSSSSYWVSSSGDHDHHMSRKSTAGVGAGPLAHGRNRSWSWAFASPMRAFSKPSSKDGKRERDMMRQASSKNTTPNLSAIPSLLTVRG